MHPEKKEDIAGLVALAAFIVLVLLLIVGGLWAWPRYRVYQQGMAGEASLRRAEHEKKVRIETARATLEAATLEAEAEQERAKGLAAAIAIVGEMAQKYPEYRNQAFIDAFAEALKAGAIEQIIYVPTEANLPILEAGKRHAQ